MAAPESLPGKEKPVICIRRPRRTSYTGTVCPTWAEISLHHSVGNSPGDDSILADRSPREKPGPVLPSEALPAARPTLPPSPQGLVLASNQWKRSLPRTGQETVPRILGPCFSPAFCPAGCDGLTCPLEADGIRQGQIACGGGQN